MGRIESASPPAFDVVELNLRQVRSLYARRMVEDFPPNELKQLEHIERYLARGVYVCYGAMAGDDILAYAFFVRLAEEGCALLDYFAARRDLRDVGVGSRFLRALVAGPLSAFRCVLLEVDDPDFAPDPEEAELRLRRLRFYLRNGAADTSVRAVVFGVAFSVLALPVGPVPSRGEAGRMYAALYRAMLPPELFEQKVRMEAGE